MSQPPKNPNEELKPVAFVTLYQGWTFIRVPKHDMILGIQINVNKCKEVYDQDGKMKLMKDGSMKPIVNFNTGLNVQTFTTEEYEEQMSLVDRSGMK